MAYKISKDSEAELRKAVSNFNSKIKRLESVDREIDIPEKESITAIKERVTNKWELNREIDKLQRFTQRDAEELIKNKSGVVLSKWEFENLQREQKRLTAKLTREINRYGNITPKEFGKKQAATYAQMGDERLSNLKARKKAISNKSVLRSNRDQLKNLQSLINKTNANFKTTKKQTFYDNYINGTMINLGYFVGYDPDKIEYIKSRLNELTPEQFNKAFQEEESLRDFQQRYMIMHEEGVIPEKLGEEVIPLLDNLYQNIDKIIEDYK